MTIFTRPQWCIEPLRPHGESATFRTISVTVRTRWLTRDWRRPPGLATSLAVDTS